jgi:LmbE family N-acetylglucosaminyl deacetylase
MKKIFSHLLALTLTLQLLIISVVSDTRPAPEDRGASGLAFVLRRLQTIASVLHTAAHPDDESTELLAYLARGAGARVAYLSLNRGEGGQNGIGPELWEALGVLRTEELLASRRLDGAEQYFTRAFDFGYTRSAEETLQKWNREEIVGDMVRVIRTLRPLVVVSGFSGTSNDGHGQHQVAGMLTPEAIKAAADPNRFPEQIKAGLQPWQALKVYSRRFGNVQGARAEFDVGVLDPALGRSYAELAADGRSRHRSQDFGQIQPRGPQVRSFPRLQSSVQTPEVESSLFTGIETSITGMAKFAASDGERLLPALNKIKDHAARAMAEYRVEQPVLIAPHLAAGLREVRALRASLGSLDPIARANVDTMLARKEREFSDALVRSHGVIVDALSNTELVTPGENVEVATNVYLGNGWHNGEEPLSRSVAAKITLTADSNWKVEEIGPEPEPQNPPPFFFRNREKADVSARFRATVPENATPTQPYWLARPRTRDQFDWDDTMPMNQPTTPPLLSAQVELTLNGERVIITQPVEYRFSDKTFGEIRRELKVAPALTLNVSQSLMIIPTTGADRARELSVEITHNARRATNGTIKLIAPSGWKIESDTRPLAFTRQGERTARNFRVTPPASAIGIFELKAIAEADGREYSRGYAKIEYPHIETRFIYHPSAVKVELFDVRAASGLKVGYVMGSGDDGPEALRQLGVNVKLISEAELASGNLSAYDTIVLGIRVYEVNDSVIANNKRLLDYVSSGGTLIVQYNKEEFVRGNFAPYPVRMERGLRVTDEFAPVKVLAPDHPLFNFPNRITDEDWKNWTQERGLYFLSEWDKQYTPLLASSDDPNRPLSGGQLIAQYGKGTYIFTAYSWFRQFPAGVPGAYRLFANLVSLPKHGAVRRK